MNTILIAENTGNSLGDIYRLPVTPEVISITDPQGIRRDVFINSGELAEIGVEKPSEIMFHSFFPIFEDTYTLGRSVAGGRMEVTPEEWIEKLKDWERKVLSIWITGTRIFDDFLMSENFDYKYIGGTGGDIDYSLHFVQYKPNFIRRVDSQRSPPIEISTYRSHRVNRAVNYVVQLDDTWISIASIFGVAPSSIMEFNRIVNKFNLLPGDTLRIPPQ